MTSFVESVLPDLPLLTHKELGLCFWSIGKSSIKNREIIGALGIEMERRIKARLNLQTHIFETTEEKYERENLSVKRTKEDVKFETEYQEEHEEDYSFEGDE